jgi:thymidine kinase
MSHDAPFTPGFFEVYCGPMKSRKSLTLIHRVETLKYMSNTEFSFFKPDIDTREKTIHSRSSNVEYECILIPSKNPEKIFDYINGQKVVLLDEAQFFDKSIAKVVNTLMDNKINVVAAGLDLDYRREPFGSMPELLALATYVKKLHAICDEPNCNELGIFTRRNQYIPGQVVIENMPNLYSVTCLGHHFILDSLEDQEAKSKIYSSVPKPKIIKPNTEIIRPN